MLLILLLGLLQQLADTTDGLGDALNGCASCALLVGSLTMLLGQNLDCQLADGNTVLLCFDTQLIRRG